MKQDLRIPRDALSSLQCPKCHSIISYNGRGFECANCETIFPVAKGIPILIDEVHSIYSIKNYLNVSPEGTDDASAGSKIFQWLPSLSRNVKAKKNYREFFQKLIEQSESPIVLIVGGRIVGAGMEELIHKSNVTFIELDVSFGPRTNLIADAHRIPFQSEFFNGVIIQAVLEHVLDPFLVVSEIHRVLKADGIIYAETPFIQQVHSGKSDFTRFTYTGHRRLFRRFQELNSGAVCGPGMALAWTYKYFLLSFCESRFCRRIAIIFAHLTAFWLKYLDLWLVNRQGSLHGAAAFFFLGRKSDETLTDKALLGISSETNGIGDEKI